METPSPRDTPPPDGPLPRILCFHGGGTSAQIFYIQTIRIQRILKHHFHFVFVDAPFESPPGPGVTPFFDEMPPYWRWTRRKPGEVGEMVRAAVERAIAGEGTGVVHGLGGKPASQGPVVGVLGFSQGGGMATGVLEEQQRHNDAGTDGYGIRFGVLCMGGYPFLPLFDGEPPKPQSSHDEFDETHRGIMSIPTLHTHGKRDPFLTMSQQLIKCFKPETTIFQEYDVEHRLPTTQPENERLCAAIMKLYTQTIPKSSGA